MRTVTKLFTAAALFFCGASFGNFAAAAPYAASLLPSEAQEIACSRTQNILVRSHYKIISVDEAFADKVITQLLGYADYNHNLLTQPEVDDITVNRDRILRAMQYCDLSYPYELYNSFLTRRAEKYDYFLKRVRSGIDVGTNGTVTIDRRKSPYAANEAELRTIWDAEITNEYINQLLNEKTPEQAAERLIKRYEAGLKKLSQTTAEDIFSVYENSFATAIDPHTNYFSPVDSQSFEDDINLSLEGIGAVLSSEDENTLIVSIIPGSPAEASKKLKPKDRIVGVRQADGTYDDIIGWRLTDAVKKIKGRKGTSVTLDIERDDGSSGTQNFQVTLVRDKIRLQDREAKGEIKTALDGTSVGVISVKSFYNGLSKDMEREIGKLNEAHVQGIVIDLRNNGGGLLPEAISSSGLFITEGPVVQVRDILGNNMPQNDPDSSVKYEGPVVVLVNHLSASSSEILAAALRDYGRAVVVGDATFGKGTVQRSTPLSRPFDSASLELGSVNFTIAKFYRINGGSTQLKGVEPDISLPSYIDESEYGERSEPNALPWDSIPPAKYAAYADLGSVVADLTRLHQDRVKDSAEFKLLEREIELFERNTAIKEISLNLEERKALKARRDAESLQITNERLKLMGKSEIRKIKDLPDDFEFSDPLLNESVNIAADLTKKIGPDGRLRLSEAAE